MPTILRETRGYDLAAAGNTLAVFWISMAAGRLISGSWPRDAPPPAGLPGAERPGAGQLRGHHAGPAEGCTMLFFGLCGFFLTSLYTYALIIATEQMRAHRDLIVTASFMVLGEVGFLLSNYVVVYLIGAYGIECAPVFFCGAGTALLLTLGTASLLSGKLERHGAAVYEAARHAGPAAEAAVLPCAAPRQALPE